MKNMKKDQERSESEVRRRNGLVSVVDIAFD